MQQVVESKISYPRELLLSLKETEQSFIRELKILAAVKLFEMGKLSLGKAAQLADMNKYQFILTLGEHKVSIFETSYEELKKDIANA
ncbi:MAG: UPF0175 family protein [candidate division KSB1 bacterium]|nr:UPF0175 family protein [candidate division KSB1 bacterium]